MWAWYQGSEDIQKQEILCAIEHFCSAFGPVRIKLWLAGVRVCLWLTDCCLLNFIIFILQPTGLSNLGWLISSIHRACTQYIMFARWSRFFLPATPSLSLVHAAACQLNAEVAYILLLCVLSRRVTLPWGTPLSHWGLHSQAALQLGVKERPNVRTFEEEQSGNTPPAFCHLGKIPFWLWNLNIVL